MRFDCFVFFNIDGIFNITASTYFSQLPYVTTPARCRL